MKKLIRSSTNSQINLSEYEYVTNVDGYQVYRKIVIDPDGKSRGVWVAQDQDRQYPPFPITYRQARGYDPITEYESNARKLGREIGQMLFGSTAITAANAKDFDRRFTYRKYNQKYSVYVKNEDDPDSFIFSISEIHPYDDGDYAWALKKSPTQMQIIRNGKYESTFNVPEWDADAYESENEYYDDIIDIACDKLKQANENVEQRIDHT